MVADLVNAFSSLALVSAGVLATFGVITAWQHLHTLAALWTTPYGVTLIVKLLVVAWCSRSARGIGVGRNPARVRGGRRQPAPDGHGRIGGRGGGAGDQRDSREFAQPEAAAGCRRWRANRGQSSESRHTSNGAVTLLPQVLELD